MLGSMDGWGLFQVVVLKEPDGCLVFLVMDVKDSGFTSQGKRENWKKRLWLQKVFSGNMPWYILWRRCKCMSSQAKDMGDSLCVCL